MPTRSSVRKGEGAVHLCKRHYPLRHGPYRELPRDHLGGTRRTRPARQGQECPLHLQLGRLRCLSQGSKNMPNPTLGYLSAQAHNPGAGYHRPGGELRPRQRGRCGRILPTVGIECEIPLPGRALPLGDVLRGMRTALEKKEEIAPSSTSSAPKTWMMIGGRSPSSPPSPTRIRPPSSTGMGRAVTYRDDETGQIETIDLRHTPTQNCRGGSTGR